jgi:hypothetical protein
MHVPKRSLGKQKFIQVGFTLRIKDLQIRSTRTLRKPFNISKHSRSCTMALQNTEAADSCSTKRHRMGALHEYLLLPFQTCLTGGSEQKESSFTLTHETSTLQSPPPSRSPTVSGSVSDNSTSSETPEDGNETSVPKTVLQEQESSFISEASLGSQAVEDDLDHEPEKGSFFLFRMSYLFVTLVVMLADGMQGECGVCFYLPFFSCSSSHTFL